MTFLLRTFTRFFPLFCITTASLWAQSDDLRLRVANMAQDLGLLTREVRALRLEIDTLRGENQALIERLRNSDALRAQMLVLGEKLDSEVTRIERAITTSDQALKKEVLTTVADQIDLLTAQISKTLNALGQVSQTQPAAPTQPSIVFDDDYPDGGLPYEVISGDTLSGIAQKMKSRVIWIQKANKIADPTKLRVGQTLFIPQAD